MPQTVAEKKGILANLPPGTIRLQVIGPNGKQAYKTPDEVDLADDEIVMNSGTPIVMRSKPGRPQKSVLPAVSPQVAQISQVREDHMGNSLVTREIGKNPEGDDTFNSILKGMADEAASIEFDRLEAQRHGQDSSDHATKRARILKSIADLILSRKKSHEGGMIDLDSPVFQTLFKTILQSFREAMEEAGTRPEHIETIFAKLVSKLADPSWKEEAKSKMKGKI